MPNYLNCEHKDSDRRFLSPAVERFKKGYKIIF